MWVVKALVRLGVCAGSIEPSLLANLMSTKILCATYIIDESQANPYIMLDIFMYHTPPHFYPNDFAAEWKQWRFCWIYNDSNTGYILNSAYSKTCVKWPLSIDQKWFSRPIIA